MGIESEYAFAQVGTRDRMFDSRNALVTLIEIARRELVNLPDAAACGLFLSNGSRLYLDAGNHPELSTPECPDPWEVVRYTLAGENILSSLLVKLREADDCNNAALFKCNVDYSGAGSTWGCHESYLHRISPDQIAAEIIPHLVSRVVFSGAGGFAPLSSGLEFTLSPRVDHLEHEISGSSTESRGIFHTKNESLCRRGYHRLHILCGESLCSQLAQFLKIGTTAIVVALIESGEARASAVRLQDSLSAMKRIARDPHCTTTVAGRARVTLAALDIQRHYLDAAERNLGAGFMPEWAADVCSQWHDMLTRLAEGPDAVSATLDWAIKRKIFREHTTRRGFDWDQLSLWSTAARQFRSIAGTHRNLLRRLRPELLHEDSPDAAEARDQLVSYLCSHGLDSSKFEDFLHLRDELFEIDTRFGQLGGDGIFAKLDQHGLLDHKLTGLASIDDAVENPPPNGRAHERGRHILELAGPSDRYAASWNRIYDREEDRYLDLSDPYGKRVTWRTGRGRLTSGPRDRSFDELLSLHRRFRQDAD
jgi:proteasome accessory factor A